MTNLTPSERPKTPAEAWDKAEKLRCMVRAVSGAISHGNRLSDIRPMAWATHFDCDSEDIRRAWEAELTKRSLKACEGGEFDGK